MHIPMLDKATQPVRFYAWNLIRHCKTPNGKLDSEEIEFLEAIRDGLNTISDSIIMEYKDEDGDCDIRF